MSITAGTYDVGGSGTDYPGVTGLDDAINDVPNSPSGLTGDLTFNVMGDVNWTVSFIKKWNGYTFKITSSVYHSGNFNFGYVITASGPSIYTTNNAGGSANVNIDGVHILGNFGFGDLAWGYPITSYLTRTIIRRTSFGSGLDVWPNASIIMNTCKIYLASATFRGANKEVENNSVYCPGVTGASGFILNGTMSSSYFRNNVIVSNGDNYTPSGLTTKPEGYNNACNSAMPDVWLGGGSNNIGDIVPANEFISLDPFSADFLKLKSGQLYNGGIDAGLTEDIEGKSIPYQGNYPIGAHVGILIRRNRIIGPF